MPPSQMTSFFNEISESNMRRLGKDIRLFKNMYHAEGTRAHRLPRVSSPVRKDTPYQSIDNGSQRSARISPVKGDTPYRKGRFLVTKRNNESKRSARISPVKGDTPYRKGRFLVTKRNNESKRSARISPVKGDTPYRKGRFLVMKSGAPGNA